MWCTSPLISQQFLEYIDLQKQTIFQLIVEINFGNKSNAGHDAIALSDAYIEIVQKQ
jgi:hypothetical protein